MPRVVLTIPFMRHYAGSVLQVPDETTYTDWPEDDRAREKQNFSAKAAYELADAGNGRSVTLLISDTVLCPEDIFEGIDLHSGPCRITSVDNSLEDGALDLDTDPALPGGLGKIRFTDNGKNLVRVLLEGDLEVKVFSRPDQTSVTSVVWDPGAKTLDFSACPPGFYQIQLQENLGKTHGFTLMKCFPLVLRYDTLTRKFDAVKTIW